MRRPARRLAMRHGRRSGVERRGGGTPDACNGLDSYGLNRIRSGWGSSASVAKAENGQSVDPTEPSTTKPIVTIPMPGSPEPEPAPTSAENGEDGETKVVQESLPGDPWGDAGAGGLLSFRALFQFAYRSTFAEQSTNERESYAVYFLQQQDMSRLDAVTYISHGVGKGEVSSEPSPPQGTEEKTESKGDKKESALQQFTVNLNDKAKAGKVDPLIGRMPEVDRTVQILCRRSKNNPLYVGDPGVGKTAIAEGLARKIVEGDVPDVLKEAVIYTTFAPCLMCAKMIINSGIHEVVYNMDYPLNESAFRLFTEAGVLVRKLKVRANG